ncbi:acetyl-CoA carboxylase biotin carboxyl carrier protein [Desulfuribacillus alkaliarsenatis]|uniref:Biotin carboxyl carrier protein of acetyl-CoA carboxylase n=1 Tax=Desulfuribacillus alkaliarsenatis TaxID=766136 RepID=A0A1E5G5H1_9FIRM|nr:acetyl-CoA carboxylase biotin carboxyl carrier protein [Desulfuribacillus alkaliarsenatis]OEF98437.1 acetyl-CoA carboxylase, biotin carboxyl carrier protein [Desulfuribacillus alkaliarsenatis]
MFKISEIKELIKLLDSTNVSELEIESEGTKLSIKKDNNIYQGTPVSNTNIESVPVVKQAVQTPAKADFNLEAQAAPIAQPAKTADSSIIEIKSPMVGTFYSSPSPDAEVYVKVGDQVKANDVVCIVEAMKLMNEIEAECNGKIVEVCVENGQLVEYGQTLFKVSKE